LAETLAEPWAEVRAVIADVLDATAVTRTVTEGLTPYGGSHMIHRMTSTDVTGEAMSRKGLVAHREIPAAPSAARWGGVMVLVMILGGSLALAEEPPAAEAPGAVTLEQAVQVALEQYQPFRVVQETLAQLHQQRRQALSAMLPTLTVAGTLTQRTEAQYSTASAFPAQVLLFPRTEDTLNLTLTQPLFTGGKAVGGFKAATALVHAGEQDVEQNREELLMNVAAAYYGVLKAHKRAELFEAEQTRLEEHRRSAEARVKVGDATKTVLLRAEAELAGAKAAVVRARSDELMAREQLALLTNLPIDVALMIPAAQKPPADPSDSLVAGAQQQRPEWLRSRFEEQAAEQQVRVARAGFFPTLSLQLTYQREAQNPDTAFFVDPDKYAIVQLQFPLFEGGLQLAKVREAYSQLRSTALNTEFLQLSIKAEVRNALRDVQALAGVVEQFTAQVAFAKENYELTSRQFAVGLATNLDVLDANSILLSAEQQLADATFDHDLAVLRLYKSLGRLFDHLLGQVE
jgi:outer membrane protein